MIKLNISGYSTALFSTWYFIEEFGLLFDAGDGLTASLLQKARKIDNVFISHADRDHLAGLLQFNQLNARKDLPRIFFPYHCGSFPALAAFSAKFDPHMSGTVWTPVKDEERIYIRDNAFVQAISNGHVATEPGIYKSFGYRLCQVKSKLRPEFLELSQERIMELMKERGKEQMTEEIITNVLTYSGDTPIEDSEKWNNTSILIHEATFMAHEEQKKLNTHGNRHSNLEDVLKMVADLNIDTLILGHFSSRYSHEQIDSKIKSLCKDLLIKIPVYRLLPGQTYTNILAGDPIN